MLSQKELTKLLRSLGNTPRKIAESLQGLGITGYSGKARSCPIANFVYSRDKEDDYGHGEGVYAFCDDYGVFAEGTSDELRYRLPKAVGEFIWEFDCGVYPSLEKR